MHLVFNLSRLLGMEKKRPRWPVPPTDLRPECQYRGPRNIGIDLVAAPNPTRLV